MSGVEQRLRREVVRGSRAWHRFRGPAPMGFYAKREQWIPFKRVRMASDLPAAERVAYETLKSDSTTFKALVQSRATRREEWFHDPVGRIGICNVPLPVRVKAH